MKEIICIVCPNGCHIAVDENGTLSGGKCKRGIPYAQKEMTNPERTLTSSVRLCGGSQRRLSVKTSAPIPKGLMFEAMEIIKAIEVSAPVKVGDVIVKNICGTNADLVATGNAY